MKNILIRSYDHGNFPKVPIKIRVRVRVSAAIIIILLLLFLPYYPMKEFSLMRPWNMSESSPRSIESLLLS